MATKPALTRSLVVWVTSGTDGTEHAVTDEQMIAGRIGRCGMYLARCEARFIAASLVTPELRRCTNCLLLLRTERAHHRAEHRYGNRLVRWARRLPSALWPLRSQKMPHPEDADAGTPAAATFQLVGEP